MNSQVSLQSSLKNIKVALVHDYLKEYGGAEKVLEDLHEIFPNAPLYTAYYNPKILGRDAKRFAGWDIRTSFIQKIAFSDRLVSPFRVLAPLAFESFDLKEYDLVISSSAIYFAKAVITKPGSLHIDYMHTPPRYLYGYVTSYNYKKHFLTRIVAELANHFLRIYDFETSQRPDVIVTNSENVRKRIKKFYRRDAVVIYPGVDLEIYKNLKKVKGDYYLSLGRLARGKGVELIVEACNRLNLPLKIAGSGPILSELKKMSGETIEFLGTVSEEQKVKLYLGAQALIVASEDEDFGITVLEAMAAGTPVIAARSGGYLETVAAGKTGEFFEPAGQAADYNTPFNPQTLERLLKVLQNFNPGKYKEDEIRKHAGKFSKQGFRQKVLKLIEENLKG